MKKMPAKKVVQPKVKEPKAPVKAAKKAKKGK